MSITPIYKGEALLHKGKFISFYEKHFEIPKNDKQTQLISQIIMQDTMMKMKKIMGLLQKINLMPMQFLYFQ